MPFIAPLIATATTAFAAVSSFVAAAGVIGQIAIAAGISIASGYLMKALAPNAAGNQITGGTQLDRTYGADVPRQVAVGLCGVAGNDVFMCTFNPSNRDYLQVFVLSDYYTTALTRVSVNGKWVTLGADMPGWPGYKLVTDDPYSSNLLAVKFYDGRQTTADSFLEFASGGRWSADNIGPGVSYVVVYSSYDKDNNNQFPEMFFEFQAAPLYDPRKDTTVGGVGAHRWNDVTTHEFSENPILAEYNYRRGFSINGDLFCGMGMPSTDLPVDRYMTGANVCDEDVDGNPRYRVSIIFNSMMQHGDNIKSCALACGAMQIDGIDGSWPLVGVDQVSVLTFTDDDIISVAGNFKYTAKLSMSELVNTVVGNYPEPDNYWSNVPYEPQIADAYLVLDRRTRDVTVDFPQVPYPDQCARLASIFLYENRYEASATLTLRPRFQVLEVGDWVDWNSARYGLQTFIVAARSLLSLESDGPRNAILQLKQRDGIIYDGVTPSPPVIPTDNDDPVYSTEVDGFAVTAVTVLADDGRQQPAFRASWNQIDDVTVTQVELQWYPTTQSTSPIYKVITAERTVAILSEGVVSDTEYLVRARIITNPARTTVFNTGVNITSANVQIGTTDLEPGIRYNVNELQSLFDDRINTIEQTISSLILEQNSRNWLDKKTLRSQFSSRTDAAFASISNVQLVVTSSNAALAQSITTLSTQVNDPITGLPALYSNVTVNYVSNSSLTATLASYTTTASAAATYATLTGLGTTNATVTTQGSAIATLNGYAAAQYSITLDVNGYGVGFNLLNGGGGISSATFTVAKFQIASPGVAGGAAVPIFTVGNINGTPKVGIRGDMYVDGDIIARHLASNSVTTAKLDAAAVNSAKIAINGVDILNIIAGAASSSDGATGNLPSGTGTVVTKSFTTKGGICFIVGTIRVSGLTTVGIVAELKIDGATVDSFDIGSTATYVNFSTNTTTYALSPIPIIHMATGLTDASHTFSISVNANPVGVSATLFLLNPRR